MTEFCLRDGELNNYTKHTFPVKLPNSGPHKNFKIKKKMLEILPESDSRFCQKRQETPGKSGKPFLFVI